MGTIPYQFTFPDPLVTISTASQCSIGGIFGNVTFTTSTLSANRAFFIPFRLTRPFIATTLFWFNGATLGSNMDIGIYTADGTKIVSTGSTAQSGTSTVQSVSISSTQLGPGLFFLAIAANAATGTVSRFSSAFTMINQASGIFAVNSSFPLPATVTFGSALNTVIPLIGMTGRSVV